MIDYYYEFEPGTVVFEQPTRFGFQRGYHPELACFSERLIHNHCFQRARRIWLENANGMILVRDQGRDCHRRIDRREVTWIKLQAREIEIS